MLTTDRPTIPIAKPELGEEEAAAAREAILSGWVTQGPRVAAFEAEFAAYVGAPHACAVSSCTAALHLALHVLGVGPGDEVVTVSHSFIATANAVRYCGATPVFVDIDPRTYNMDPTLLEAAITPRTRAVGRVQLGRLPELLERRRELARHYDQILCRVPGLVPPHVPPDARPNYQSYAVRVTPEYPLSRDELMAVLLEHGITTRRGIMN